MYGIELWDSSEKCKMQFKSLSITYHKCLKRLMGLPPWYGNHDICERVGVLTFKHGVNYEIFKFASHMINTESPCVKPFKLFLNSRSVFISSCLNIGRVMYQIPNVLENDFDAVLARIYRVQNSEPRSN